MDALAPNMLSSSRKYTISVQTLVSNQSTSKAGSLARICVVILKYHFKVRVV